MTTHDYIGLGEATSADKVSSSASAGGSSTLTTSASEEGRLKYKETELRLGLPGSESPERKLEKGGGGDGGGGGYGGVVLKSFMSGAKRGFSDAIDGHGKWVFPGGGGVGEVEVGKGGALFSPRGGRSPAGVDGSVQQQGLVGASVAKEVGSLAAKPAQEKKPQISAASDHAAAPASKAQVVGWPPIRSFRKNTMASNSTKDSEDADNSLYVKVSMDGAPYLRKVSLKTYSNYKELSSALEKMFSCFTIGQFGSHGAPGRDGLSERRLKDLLHGSEYVLTYEDKDGDWMLVGDVPWEMFIDSCKRLRIMMGTEAIGLAPRAMEKCKNRN